jgi:predicted RNA-binding Zn-ribbon protein involved in translation (DUF1610 family)
MTKICPKCRVEMKIGKVLEPYDISGQRSSILGGNIGSSKSPTLVECYKCPECGHSEPINF